MDTTAYCKFPNYNKDFYEFLLTLLLFVIKSLEKFSTLTHQISGELDVFIQTIHDTEFPNSVEATENLLIEQCGEYARLKVKIPIIREYIEKTTFSFKFFGCCLGGDFNNSPTW